MSVHLQQSEAGKLGAAARWQGQRRIVRLTELDPLTRRLVLALVDGAKSAENEKTPAAIEQPAGVMEATRDGRQSEE